MLQQPLLSSVAKYFQVVSPSVYHFIQFVSSAGRASALQAECHRFKSYTNYQGLRFYQVFLTIPAQAKCRKQQERITLNSLEKIDAIPPNVKKRGQAHQGTQSGDGVTGLHNLYGFIVQWLESQTVTLKARVRFSLKPPRARWSPLRFANFSLPTKKLALE